MIPAPLVASAETKPRSIRSISTGDSPVLMTCAPIPHTMPRPARRASTMAVTTALKSRAASIDGSESRSPGTPDPARYGLAKSSARALLGLLFSG